MLIQALCDYYDLLAASDQVLPDGYSKVQVHYGVSLTPEGMIDEIYNVQRCVTIQSNGKSKEKWIPKSVTLPKRTEKPGIDSNKIEHRPLYLFGLNLDNDELTSMDRTNKAKKSHEAFIEVNLAFIEGLHSPIIDAYRKFILQWDPLEETENVWLKGLGKAYASSSFIFSLSGNPDILLHEDKALITKWEEGFHNTDCVEQNMKEIQCAITGEIQSAARIHSKIKGVFGGLATGSVLVGFNNASECSYGNEQAYNSNISETAMKKYTEALNYLLSSNSHRIGFDDLTIVFWAMSSNNTYEDNFLAMLWGQTDNINANQTEQLIHGILDKSKTGRITVTGLDTSILNDDVDFYMVGIKPNSSRLAIKFIMKKKYADILWNIARFQNEIQITKDLRPISFFSIKRELISPKSKSESINPALLTKLMESVLYGQKYPYSLLETLIRRVKTDESQRESDRIRMGLIRACINRNYEKEELNMALDIDNKDQAYLCGRLFAVLEKLQQDASNNTLNRTIKDSYFAAASSKPAIVFPKIIRLAQNHLNKVNIKSKVYYNRLLGEITAQLQGMFPDLLLLKDQGKFIIGYYQQYQSFFEKKENKEEINNDRSEQV